MQKVLVKDFNLVNAQLDRNYTRTRVIRKNYRNSRQILLAADSLIRKYGDIVSKEDEYFELLKPEFAIWETAKPIALRSTDVIGAAWRTAQDWILEGENQPWTVCLATPNLDVLPISKIMERTPSNLKSAELTGDYVEQPDTVSIGTLADVKGLEFGPIIIVGCSNGTLPDRTIPKGEHWRDAMRLYVAMTRGRDQVVITYQGKPSMFLQAMKEHLLWQE